MLCGSGYFLNKKNTCVKGNPTLPKFTGETLIFFLDFQGKFIILCIFKGEMHFKMHKIIFFSRKRRIKKKCVCLP